MSENRSESWREYMTEADYKLITEHMDSDSIRTLHAGFDEADANQLMGMSAYGLIMPWNLSKEELAEKRKRLPEILRRLDERKARAEYRKNNS